MWGTRTSEAERNAKIDLAERVLASPRIEPIAREADLIRVRERAELVKRLQEARAAVSPEEGRKLLAKVAAAEAAMEAARQALKKAQSDQVAAMAAMTARTGPAEHQAATLEAELRRGADPRIAALAAHIEDLLLGPTRQAVTFPTHTTDVIGQRSVRYVSNITEVNAARALLTEARAAMRGLELEALDRDAVTVRLVEWRDRIQAALGPLFGTREPVVTPYEITLD